MEDVKSDQEFQQFLTFEVGNELYGIEVDNVREVIDLSNVTHVPRSPDYMKGIINLRGEVVPVVNLPVLFYGRISEETKFTCIVVIEVYDENEKHIIGILIDAVRAVVDLTEDNIETTPDFGVKIRYDYTAGVGKLQDLFIILLNINAILNIEDLSDFNKKRGNIISETAGNEPENNENV